MMSLRLLAKCCALAAGTWHGPVSSPPARGARPPPLAPRTRVEHFSSLHRARKMLWSFASTLCVTAARVGSEKGSSRPVRETHFA